MGSWLGRQSWWPPAPAIGPQHCLPAPLGSLILPSTSSHAAAHLPDSEKKKKKSSIKICHYFQFSSNWANNFRIVSYPAPYLPPPKNNSRWFPSVCHLLLALKYTCAINFNCVIKLFIHRLKQLCTDVHWWCHNASRRNFISHLNHPSFHKKKFGLIDNML